MKDKVEEMNAIHNKIAELRSKMLDLERDIGTGNSVGMETRDLIYKEQIVGLVEEYDNLIARLKKVVEW